MGTGTITTIWFPGDPETRSFWSEENATLNGESYGSGSSRTMLVASGPFTMQPGDVEEIIYAIVWSRGEDRLDSVRLLKSTDARLINNAEELLAPNVTRLPPVPPEIPDGNAFAEIFPNPVAGTATFRYQLAEPAHVRINVLDLLGRQVSQFQPDGSQPGIFDYTFDSSQLAPGVYFYRVEIGRLSRTEKMVVSR